MKRITLAEDVKMTALRTSVNRTHGTVNGHQNGGRRWLINIRRGDQSVTLPYYRCGGLSGTSGIDLTVALKALMLEQALLVLYPDPQSRAEFAVHRNMKADHWTRLERAKRGLVRVLGDEYQRILDIVLHNLMELANAPA